MSKIFQRLLNTFASFGKTAETCSIIAASFGTTAATGWWLADTKFFRKYRMEVYLQTKLQNFNLDGKKLILKETLVSDIKTAVATKSGVKILCTPQGSGKTTTIRCVLNNLLSEKKIKGVIIMTAPDSSLLDSKTSAAVWFRQTLTDWRGEILKPREKLSELLPYTSGSPYVFVIDQAENMELDENMRIFIKTLAEDSTLVKSYLTFVICSDAVKSKTMWDWNGRTKIVLGTRRPLSEYRWNSDDIEDWLNHFSESHPELVEGSYQRVALQNTAVIAGTPGFLIDSTSDVTSVQDTELNEKAKYYDQKWKSISDLIGKW